MKSDANDFKMNKHKDVLAYVKRCTGIKRSSIFFELKSMIFPWSFPLDSMHLFYLNIAKHMRDYWRANFYPDEIKQKIAKTNRQKFRKNNEPYSIDPVLWTEMNKDLSKIKLPTSFGDKIRGIYEFRKANEWKTWVKVITILQCAAIRKLIRK